MNKLKIIGGLVIVLAIASEFANVLNQADMLTVIFLGIVVVIPFIVIAAWLIGSGIYLFNLSFKSAELVKIFLLTFIPFLLLTYFFLAKNKLKKEIVTFNNININIGDCIEGTRNIIPDLSDRKITCSCLAEKIAYEEDRNPKYKDQLQAGKIDLIIESIKKDDIYFFEDLQTCFTNKVQNK
jgi:hypothetical protein